MFGLGEVEPRIFNQNYIQKIASAGTEKLAAETGTAALIRDRVREESFASQVLTPRKVQRSDCQVSTNHDTLSTLLWLEPESRAVALDFRGAPKSTYITGNRMECAFYTIASERYEKTEQELMVYPFPITKVIEDNVVKDMREIRDRHFIIWAEAAVQALQTEANAGSVTSLNATTVAAGSVTQYSVFKSQLAAAASANNSVALPVQPQDFIDGVNAIVNRRLVPQQILLGDSDWNNTMGWSVQDWGSKVGDIRTRGSKENLLHGYKVIRTIKSDILRPGNIYYFTHEDYLGRLFLLTETKFYIDKIANLLMFQAWEDLSMAFANVASISKTETYSGDATSLNVDSILTRVAPVAEAQLGAVNNRVARGVHFPSLAHY